MELTAIISVLALIGAVANSSYFYALGRKHTILKTVKIFNNISSIVAAHQAAQEHSENREVH